MFILNSSFEVNFELIIDLIHFHSFFLLQIKDLFLLALKLQHFILDDLIIPSLLKMIKLFLSSNEMLFELKQDLFLHGDQLVMNLVT